jgi:hypothetical protein
MKLRIALFILSVAAMAAFGLFTQVRAADTVIINNYQPSTRFCWGIIGCLVAHAMDEQDRQAQGPHACNVWNGRAWVGATCQ